MNADQCVAFLHAIGAKKIRVKENGWVEASCPLAPWTHKKHADHSPSFGLSIVPGGRSRYQCFACQSGSAEELLQTMELYAKENLSQYDFATAHQLLDAEPAVLPLPEYGEFQQANVPFVEWPQYWLESFKTAEWCTESAVYLAARAVPLSQVKEFDLRYDSKRHMIVAPYRDVFGRLAGARGRSILAEVSGPGKHYDYSWEGKNNCRLVWYNEEVLNLNGPVVIVEGQFDCWRTVQAYPKTIAALTAKPSWEKFKKLGDCSMVIQIPDRDEAGMNSVGLYAEYCLKLGISYRSIVLGDGVKDPDECSPDYLRDRIEELL